MRTFLIHIWARLRTSFWFVPGMLVTSAVLLGYGSLAIDRAWGIEILSTFPQLRDVSADGVRTLLSTAATSVLTLAGITFSSTLVALTLASSQYGGRLLRNFIRSFPNQISLGILLGNFVFCLIVLRSVRSIEDGEFIPHAAALIGFVGTIVSLVTFIIFIHHIATSLQADTVISNVYEELDDAIERHFPKDRPGENDEELEDEAYEDKAVWHHIRNEFPVVAPKSGCIQAIAIQPLVDDCKRLDLRCRILHRPGHFVNAGTELLALSGENVQDLGDDDHQELLEAFIIGRIRTAEQDFEYCIRQLVEVSLRALSPGINDPFTAMNCIDYLGAALAKVARRTLPNRHFSDEDGVQRVSARPTMFKDLLDAAFHQIRQTAGDKTDIALRLLGSLAGIGANVMLPKHAAAVVFHAEIIADMARDGAKADCDAEAIDAALKRVHDRLTTSSE